MLPENLAVYTILLCARRGVSNLYLIEFTKPGLSYTIMHKRVNNKQNSISPAAVVSQTRSHLWWCAVLVIITFASFHTSLNHDFTNWDDDQYVVNNPDIRGFSVANLSKILSTPYVDNYQPVTMLSYMIDYSLTGLDPSAYHGTNLALHIVNAILVYLLFFLLTGNRFTSGLTALLFAIHPLRVESVAWIAERKDMLFLLFYLLACINYIWYTKYKHKKLLVYALCAGIVSMLSKPMAVSLPCALILIDYVQGKTINVRSLKNKIPFVAAAAAVALIALITQKSTHVFSEFNSMSTMLYRICIPFYDCIFYLYKTILPVHLCALYNYTTHPAGFLRIAMLISPAIVLAAGFAVWHFRKTFPFAGVCIPMVWYNASTRIADSSCGQRHCSRTVHIPVHARHICYCSILLKQGN